MARASRNRSQNAAELPPVIARLITGLESDPRPRMLMWIAVLSAIGLFGSGLGYPLVFGDLAVLQSAKLALYASQPPAIGASWLSDASFGWSALLVGERWPWHRALNIGLHALAVAFACACFRRLCGTCVRPASNRLASGWVAFFAASLFALNPVAVYAVAYLSERTGLLLGVFTLIALWGTLRAAQDGWRGAWVVVPLACVGALLTSAHALAIGAAIVLVAIYSGAAQPAHRRLVLGVAAIAVMLSLAYALALAGTAVRSTSGPMPSTLDNLAMSSWRLLNYLAFWIAPLPVWLAVDLPEPSITAAALWPGTAAIAAIAVLAVMVIIGLRQRRNFAAACIALGVGCALALSSSELLWPRLAAPLALPRSYAAMMFVCLVPAALIACMPARIAFAAGWVGLIIHLVFAGSVLNTFASHVGLWNAAVQRVERFGPHAQDARVYLNRAAVHRRDGHTLAAIADYDRALALQPDQVRALRARAQAYVDDKRYADALRDLDRVLALEPQHAITHADRGLVLLQADRLNEAGAALDRALQQGAKEPRVYLNRGLTRFKLSGIEGAAAALDDIEEALRLDPRYALAYLNRGVIFEQAANAGARLRDAATPEIMRSIAARNIARACELGHAAACARTKEASIRDALPGGRDGPIKISPEQLRQHGLPPLE